MEIPSFVDPDAEDKVYMSVQLDQASQFIKYQGMTLIIKPNENTIYNVEYIVKIILKDDNIVGVKK